MIVALSVAAAVAAAQPAPAVPRPALADIAHAIEARRLNQARVMIARAIAAGEKGEAIDRLTADLAFANGKNAEALARYEQLMAADPNDVILAEQAGIAALRLGETDHAAPLLARATKSASATWRAWNAKGVLADLRADWLEADTAYERAAALSPDNAEVINNRGWSHLLRGEWAAARSDFERAATLDRKSTRIANNLELARAAMAADLPNRRAGESDRDWAGRLNDAGMAARIMGNSTKAIAAFTQALEASGSWYARAANNLAAVKGTATQ